MKRHRFDPFSFLFGIVFLVLGITFWFRPEGGSAPRLQHLGPAALLVVGLTLACWALATAFRRPEPMPGSEFRPAPDPTADERSDTAPD
jgi:hypothetical protein